MASKSKIKCKNCEREMVKAKFYSSNLPEYKKLYNGTCPVCKECLQILACDENGGIDATALKDVLKNYLNKPFFNDIFLKVLSKKPKNPLGDYITRLNLNRGVANNATWKDGETEEKIEIDKKQKIQENKNIEIKKNEVKLNSNELQKLVDKYGYGYTEEEYIQFEKKWKKLIDNYGEKTALHTENLITYIRFRVKEEMSTAKGDVKAAKDWGALATQAAKDAKLNVAQLSKSDISGGVDVVCQIFEALESEIGVIPLLPKLIEQPYDDADLIIWANINYNRRLEDKAMIQYRDIWCFYDEMLEEYFKQQGYDKNQINEFKEKRHNVFRDLQQIYKEPLYEEEDDL